MQPCAHPLTGADGEEHSGCLCNEAAVVGTRHCAVLVEAKGLWAMAAVGTDQNQSHRRQACLGKVLLWQDNSVLGLQTCSCFKEWDTGGMLMHKF
jgi:hypothetical protein